MCILQLTVKLTAVLTSHFRQFPGYTFHVAEDCKADSSPHITLSVIGKFPITLCMLQRTMKLTAVLTCCRGNLLCGLQPTRDTPTFWSCCCLMGPISTLQIKRYFSNILLSIFLLHHFTCSSMPSACYCCSPVLYWPSRYIDAKRHSLFFAFLCSLLRHWG